MSAPPSTHIAWSKVEPARRRFNLADSAIAAPVLASLRLPDHGGLPAVGYELLGRLERALGERLQVPGGMVRVTAGASEANACVLGGLLERGDEVLVERPGYQPHVLAARLFGLTLRHFDRSEATGAGGLETAVEAARTAATRMVVLTDLHNPAGTRLTETDLESLDRLAERHGFWVFVDETFRDADRARPVGTAAGRGSRWVGTSSLTKSYGLGGLRIGWVTGAPEALERCGQVQDALSVVPSLPSVSLACDLLPHLDALRDRTLAILAENHGRWTEFLERGAPFTTQEALGTTAWCRFTAPGDGDAFAVRARREFDLAVTPGRFFGDSSGMRVGLGDEPERFASSLAALARALQSFRPSSIAGELRAGVSTRESA
ncbi:MAG TPA: pyridoxal phosphate-dependent aminotransferase [Candidatus Limnocylindria bacterium]|nr:pyridoxal phosphate-dependent aminotransferase [Candidatus Limnocylindria bacterium]